MDEKKRVIWAIVLPTVSVIGFMSCKGPTGPQGPEGSSLIYIIGSVAAPTPLHSTAHAYVRVSNTPVIPTVTINGTSLPLASRPPYVPGHYGEIIEFKNNNFPISTGDSAKLLVTYTRPNGNPGRAEANIILPGLEITSHDTSSDITIPFGESLTITWISHGADAYRSVFYLCYAYYDTLGHYCSFEYRVDTLFTDTSITFFADELFPNLGIIDSIGYSSGHFNISAIAGPWHEGAEGNVTGDGIGFFYGCTWGGHLSVTVSGSEYLEWERKNPTTDCRDLMEECKEAQCTLIPSLSTQRRAASLPH